MHPVVIAAIIGACGLGVTCIKDVVLTLIGYGRENRRRKAEADFKMKIFGIVKKIVLIAAICFLYIQVIKHPNYQIETGLYYSAGDQSNWSYMLQQKEYSASEPCYVRFSTKVTADNWRGKRSEVGVRLTFDSGDIAKVSLVDGVPIQTMQEDTNKITYEFIVEPDDKEMIAIFRYDPKRAGEVSVDVQYDDKVKSSNNMRNTIFFKD